MLRAVSKNLKQVSQQADKGVTDAATAQTAANNAQSTADYAKRVADAALPKAGGTITGNLVVSGTTTCNNGITGKGEISGFSKVRNAIWNATATASTGNPEDPGADVMESRMLVADGFGSFDFGDIYSSKIMVNRDELNSVVESTKVTSRRFDILTVSLIDSKLNAHKLVSYHGIDKVKVNTINNVDKNTTSIEIVTTNSQVKSIAEKLSSINTSIISVLLNDMIVMGYNEHQIFISYQMFNVVDDDNMKRIVIQFERLKGGNSD